MDGYIIENSELRNIWGKFIGDVSASHHWNISTVESKLGVRGIIPDPEGGDMDLAFVACALRIIDYAHINSDRANFIERLLRSSVDNDSLVHWKAQEQIIGPRRQSDKLKYATTRPIQDLDAWWLFYNMASGLHKEITNVSEYLSTKPWSKSRFSLDGVVGVNSPQSLAAHIEPDGFEPVDVRFKPDSIERLVDILGGKTLYGNDQYAPLRELLQNSRDAILLRQSYEEVTEGEHSPGKIIIGIEVYNSKPHLVISDDGVGMNSDIIINYLLGIASDYWNSQDYYTIYSGVIEKGFKPTGKFGIGFLSVFMLGDNIEVETQKRGGAHFSLTLKGLGKLGSIRKSTSRYTNGTTIKVALTKQDAEVYNNLDAIVRARAPMLTIPVHINQDGQKNILEDGWWKKVSQDEFFEFIQNWEKIAYGTPPASKINHNREYELISINSLYYNRQRERVTRLDETYRLDKWPNKQPEIISDKFRILAIPNFSKIIICSKGIAVTTIRIDGMVGIAEIEDITLNAARSEAIHWDRDMFREIVLKSIKPKIVAALDDLEKEGVIPSRFNFLTLVGNRFGNDVLSKTTLPWVSIIVPPGNILLHTFDEAKVKIAEEDEVVITYRVHPWAAEVESKRIFPSTKEKVIIFPVSSEEDERFGSYDEKEIVTGNFLSHFLKKERYDQIKSARLLSTIKLVSIAWGIDIEFLLNANWTRHETNFLGVHLKKSDYI